MSTVENKTARKNIPVAKPWFSEEETRLVAEALQSGWVAQGPKVKAFEKGIADYTGSLLGFLGIFYSDNKMQYRELGRKERFKRIMKNAFSLWPSVAAADVAYILARPSIHYILLVSGLEAGIAATIAHFAAFGVFNGVAMLSRSIVDYLRSNRQ